MLGELGDRLGGFERVACEDASDVGQFRSSRHDQERERADEIPVKGVQFSGVLAMANR